MLASNRLDALVAPDAGRGLDHRCHQRRPFRRRRREPFACRRRLSACHRADGPGRRHAGRTVDRRRTLVGGQAPGLRLRLRTARARPNQAELRRQHRRGRGHRAIAARAGAGACTARWAATRRAVQANGPACAGPLAVAYVASAVRRRRG